MEKIASDFIKLWSTEYKRVKQKDWIIFEMERENITIQIKSFGLWVQRLVIIMDNKTLNHSNGMYVTKVSEVKNWIIDCIIKSPETIKGI